MLNINAIYASYTEEEIATARKAFDAVVLDEVDAAIDEDEHFNGLNRGHVVCGVHCAILRAADISGIRPRDIYILLGGAEGAQERAGAVRFAREGYTF